MSFVPEEQTVNAWKPSKQNAISEVKIIWKTEE
jgi:hypothetical protein